MQCNLKNDRMILVHFQGKPFNNSVIQVYAPTTDAEEAEVNWFYEDLQHVLELTQKKTDVLFIIGDWNANVGSQEIPKSGSESHSVVSNFLWPYGLQSPWNPPGQNTEVSSLSLLQGIFPTQGSNPGLPHCRQILYQLSHQGSPRIQEWVVYPFSSRSSQPRNQNRVSCIAGGFFTSWATREAHKKYPK